MTTLIAPYIFACLLLFGLCPAAAEAQEARDGLFAHSVGAMEVTLMVDAVSETDPAILRNASPEAVKTYLPKGAVGSVNAFLIRSPAGLLLADTGFGRQLFAHLGALGVKPEEVDTVLLTHMHSDHIGGLLRDGKPSFPNAELWVSTPEKDYWAGKSEQAKAILAAYDGRVRTFMPAPLRADAGVADAGVGLFPGLRAVAAFGHTPGHTMFLLESGNERLLLWGDLTHALAVQTAYPEITVTYDVDPNAAGAVRQDVLRWVTANKVPVAGMHVPLPGMGNVHGPNTAAPRYVFEPLKK